MVFGPLMICHLIMEKYVSYSGLNSSLPAAWKNRVLAVSPNLPKPSVSLPALQVLVSHLSHQMLAVCRQRKANRSSEEGGFIFSL